MPVEERPRRFPTENWLGQTQARQGAEPQERRRPPGWNESKRSSPCNMFSFPHLGTSLEISGHDLEGSPRIPYMQLVTAGTHWSEDTLGLPMKKLACCVCSQRSRKGVTRVNFPLSTYSVFREKNVSPGNENTFEGTWTTANFPIPEDRIRVSGAIPSGCVRVLRQDRASDVTGVR